jgi:hypothetical protein
VKCDLDTGNGNNFAQIHDKLSVFSLHSVYEKKKKTKRQLTLG